MHEDIRLLAEIGLNPAQIYEIASRNPGMFITDTLALDTGFGTLEPGTRADILLLTGNPLEDLAVLKRPAAVISRGRMWSRAFLDARLELLRAKYNP